MILYCVEEALVFGVLRKSANMPVAIPVAAVCSMAVLLLIMPTESRPKTESRQKAVMPTAIVTSTREKASRKAGG